MSFSGWHIPEFWQERLHEHLGEERRLGAGDFPYGQSVLINLRDGSFAFFHLAFALESKELQEVAVFTEHCGYHNFPMEGTEVTTLTNARIAPSNT